MRSLSASLILSALGLASAVGPVVLTGATGKTGSLTYKLLKSRGIEVRAVVRNVDKAREVLSCKACDASEGIYVGDITKPETLAEPMKSAGALVILTSAIPQCEHYPDCTYRKGAYPIDIDFHAGKNQVEAFAKGAASPRGPVVLISAAGTTEPDSELDKMGNGHISFYKLNMEAFLMSSGLPFRVIKPCGLGDGEPAQSHLVVGHDDSEGWDLSVLVPRADVARVVAEALNLDNDAPKDLRFDLCAQAQGDATADADLPSLLKSAAYPWQHKSMEEIRV